MDFKGKNVLITGSSRGIGKAVALRFAEAGANICINYTQSSEKAEEVKKEIESFGVKTIIIKADVSDEAQVKEMFETIKTEFGGLDILINNAAVYKDSVVWKMDKEVWDEVINIDLSGVFNCTKHAIGQMRERGYGRVITVSSVVGQVGGFGVCNYSAAKAGVIGFTKTVAREVATKNITVNTISLGFIETGMLLRLPEEIQDAIVKTIPMRRWGDPKEVAATVLFIASEDASYITGQTINVNGGYHM